MNNRTPIKYDFLEMEDICRELIGSGGKSVKHANALKKELNIFFKDSKCIELIVTNNTDKLFFGAMVMPRILANNIEDILFSDKPVRITDYSLELDSKLFNPILNINSRELVAIILHEVGHVINTSEPIEDIRKILDEYCAKNNQTLKIYDSIHYKELLTYGIKEYISKRGSLFTMRDTEILADEFVYMCGYGSDLEDIMDRISANGLKIHSDNAPSYMTLLWTLDVYKNTQIRRIGALKTLSRAKSMIASRLEKLEIENAIRRLNKVDDSISENAILDAIKEKMGKMKHNSLKQFEDDYFEYNMRARNVEEEDDALYLMRQINTRISIIDDYIATEDLTDSNRRRWDKLLENYRKLREKLSNTHTYKTKNIGIVVNYPEIKENNY